MCNAWIFLKCWFCLVRMNIIKVGPGPRVRGVHAPNLSHLGRDFNSGACSSRVAFDPLYVTSLCLRPKSLSRSQCQPVLISRQPLHICLAGGQGMMENNGVRIHFFFFSFTLLVIDFFFFQLDAPSENLILLKMSKVSCILWEFLLLLCLFSCTSSEIFIEDTN